MLGRERQTFTQSEFEERLYHKGQTSLKVVLSGGSPIVCVAILGGPGAAGEPNEVVPPSLPHTRLSFHFLQIHFRSFSKLSELKYSLNI